MLLKNTYKVISITLLLSVAGQSHAMIKWLLGNTFAYPNGAVIIGDNNVNVVIDGVAIKNQNGKPSEQTEERVFDVADQSVITIKNNVGNISITSHEGADTRLIITKRGAENDLPNVDADINTSSNTLTIVTRYKKPMVQASVNYQLLLPKNKQISLNLSTISGSILARDINGPVRLSSSSGNLEAENIAKNVECTVISGNVTVNHVKGSARMRVSSGTICATEVAGTIDAQAISGNITIHNDILNNACNLRTTSGNIRIKARVIDANLNVQQGFSGSFYSQFKIDGTKKNGTIGNGGAPLNISVISGNIVIEKAHTSKL